MSFLSKLFLNFIGYKIDDNFINDIMDGPPKIIIFPHTSKFEAFLGCVVSGLLNGNIKFACTDKFMDIYILGDILEYFGGFKITDKNLNNKDASRGYLSYISRKKIYSEESAVIQITKFLQNNPRCSFVISPEGKLRYEEKWHRGFYEIAKATGYPIAIGGIDFFNHKIKINDELIYVDDDKFKGDDVYKNVLSYTQDRFKKSKIYPRHPKKCYPHIDNFEITSRYPNYIHNHIIVFWSIMVTSLYYNNYYIFCSLGLLLLCGYCII